MSLGLRLLLRLDGADRASADIRVLIGNLRSLQGAGRGGPGGPDRLLIDIRIQAQLAQRSVESLRNTFLAFLSVSQAISFGQSIAEQIDAIVNAESRLRLTTDTIEEFNEAQQKTFAIAQQNRTSYEQTANLYARLSRSLGDLKDAELIALRTTDLITKSFVISGGSAKSANAAITQLIQGLAAGALRGDEFNSVVEQAPRLQEALSAALGVNVGQLRKLAEQGKLTADFVISALLSQGEVIDNEFTKIPVTIGQSLEVVQNGFGSFVTSVAQAGGKLDSFTGAIVILGQILESLANLYKATGDNSTQLGVETITLGQFFQGLAVTMNFVKNVLDLTVASFIASVKALGGVAKVGAGLIVPLIAAADALRLLVSGDSEEARLRLAAGAAAQEELITGGLDDIAAAYQSVKASGEANFRDFLEASAAIDAAAENSKAAALKAKTGFDGLSGSMDASGFAALAAAAKGTESARELERAQARLDKINKTAGKAVDDLNELLRDQEDILNPQNKALTENERTKKKLLDIEEALMAQSKINVEAIKNLTQAYSNEEKILRLRAQQNESKIDSLYELIQGYEEETNVLTLSGEAQQRRSDELDVSIAKDKLAKLIQQQKITISGQERSVLEKLVEAMILRRKETERQIQLDEELRNSGPFSFVQRGASGLNEVFNAGSLEEAIGQAITNGFKEANLGSFFRDLTSSLRNAFSKDPKAAVGGIISFAERAIAAFDGNTTLKGITTLASELGGTVGAIASAVNFIDSLTGGKLLGTKFEQVAAGFSVVADAFGAFVDNIKIEERERSFFRGTKERTTTSRDSEATRAINQFFDKIDAELAIGARRLGTIVPDIIGGAFQEIKDKEGNIITRTSKVLGVIYDESFEEFQKRVRAENLIALVAKSVGNVIVEGIEQGSNELGDLGDPGGAFDEFGRTFRKTIQEGVSAQGTVVNEAQAIAQRWRASADTLQEGAEFLLLAQTAIVEGNALLDGASLTETTDFVEELNFAGETLSQTFERLVTATGLLKDTLQLLGVELDLSSEAFVRFGAEVVDALGGLDEAGRIYGEFIQGVFSETERAQVAVTNATARALSELSDVGIDDVISIDEFKRRMNLAIAEGLTDAELAEWIQAGAALSGFNAAVARVTELSLEATEAEQERLETLQEAYDDYEAFFGNIRNELNSGFDDTDFEASIRAAATGLDEMIEKAQELATAANLPGVAIDDLASIAELTSQRIQNAIKALEVRTRNLVDKLFPKERLRAISDEGFVQNRSLLLADQPVLGDRFESALELANNFRELSSVLKKDVFETIEGFGVPLRKFIEDFGVDFNLIDKNVPGVFDQLVAAARALGAELPTLGQQLGLNIGELFDDSSFINDALERAILGSGTEVTSVLSPLLDALEAATSPELRASALQALVDAINLLSPDLRSAFEPFFDEVDPQSDVAAQIERLRALESSIREQTPILADIRRAIVGGPTPGPDGYRKSSTVPQDQTAVEVRSFRQEAQESSESQVEVLEDIKTELSDLRKAMDSLSNALTRVSSRAARVGG